MFKKYSKRFLSLVLAVSLVMSYLMIGVSATFDPNDTVKGDGGMWSDTCDATIYTEGEVVAINLNFRQNFQNYTGDWTPQLDKLFVKAVDTYNSNHGTAYTTNDIKNIVVTSATNIRLAFVGFLNFLKTNSYAERIEVLDLSGAAFTQSLYGDQKKIQNNLFAAVNGDCYFPCLKTLKLDGTLFTTIDANAFNNMIALETVTLPQNLTTIGNDAFSNCYALKEIPFPNSLSSLGDTIFYGCPKLESWSYHGSGDSIFIKKLLQNMNETSYTKVDLSGSAITVPMAMNLRDNLLYLDLRECPNMDLSTTDGILFLDKVEKYKKGGAEVHLPAGSEGNLTVPTDTDHGVVTVEDGKVVLTLNFKNTYYNAQSQDPYNDLSDARGRSMYISKIALIVYNFVNGTEYELSDVNVLRVKTEGTARITEMFCNFFQNTDIRTNLEEIDMYDAAVSSQRFGWQAPEEYEDNALATNFYGSYGDNAHPSPQNLKKLKKIVLPKDLTFTGHYAFQGLKALETVVFNDKLTRLGDWAFKDTTNLKTIAFPDSMYSIATETFLYSGIEEIAFHGMALKASDPVGFFNQLILQFNTGNYSRLDLSGSAIMPAQALLIKDTVQYLDLRNCVFLEYKSEDGMKLYEKLMKMKEKGAEVYMPTAEELEGKYLVTAESNDDSMGEVFGTNVYDSKEAPSFEVTFTAKVQPNYELIGWQVSGVEEMYEPGPVNSDGFYEFKYTVTGAVTVTGIFEISSSYEVPEGNTATLDENDRIHIVLTNITAETQVSIYTQALVKKLRLSTGKHLTASNIASLSISTAPSFTWGHYKRLSSIFPTGFNQGIRYSVEKIDVSNVKFEWNEVPERMFSGYAALTEVILPNNITNMGYFSFESCSSLTTIDVPETVTVISKGCFRASGLESITLPDGIKRIESQAFADCRNFMGTANGVLELPDGIEKFCSQDDDGYDYYVVGGSYKYTEAGTQWMFLNAPLKGIAFHGKGSPATFSRIFLTFDWYNAHYDLSNSGLTEKELAQLPFTSPAQGEPTRYTYLDIRGCDIDYTTPLGKYLRTTLEKFAEANSEVTVLMDDGIIRDTSYTQVDAEITLEAGQSVEEALKIWSEANENADVTTITHLVVKTNEGRELSAADFTAIKNTLINSLRYLDISEVALKNNEIPESAMSNVEKLTEVKLPKGIKVIGASAFYNTNLLSFDMPQTVTHIGNSAFGKCYALSGEIKLPNNLVSFGSSVFDNSPITRLEYHGPLKVLGGFGFGRNTIEYLDLRGCYNLGRWDFPNDWASLKAANLDYCNFTGILNGEMYWSLLPLIERLGPVFTVHKQGVAYTDIEAMLMEDIYGKLHDEYPKSDTERNPAADINYGIWDVLEGLIFMDDSNSDTEADDEYDDDSFYDDDDDYTYIDDDDNSSNENESGKKPEKVKKKKVVVVKRKKVPTTAEPTVDYTWIIWVAVAGGVVLAGCVTLFIVLMVKRKKKRQAN